MATHSSLLVSLSVSLVFGNSLAYAEIGDYTATQTSLNKMIPRIADRPITSADRRLVPLPINQNPTGFQDGFDPKKYDTWQQVKLDPSTGAKCGDGSPFSFWVNRKASTSNVMFFLEGGGACWDHESCSGGLTSSNVLSNVWLSQQNKNTSAVISPSALSIGNKTSIIPIYSSLLKSSSTEVSNKVQNWTKVFVPYCTGDVHVGLSTRVYSDPSVQKPPVTVHHNGVMNNLQTAAWVRNHLEAPQQLLLAGQSAGGVGAVSLYHALRLLFPVQQGYMLNDAGPAFFADQQAGDAQNPSAPLHRTALPMWGLSERRALTDGSNRSLLDWYQTQLAGFDTNNFGTLNQATARRWPKDRFSMALMQEDYVFGSYSYRKFFPQAQVTDRKQRRANTLALWKIDVDRFATQMQTSSNYGYYLPATRSWLYGHTLTSNSGNTADIQEQRLTLNAYLDNLMNPNVPLIKAKEQDVEADRKQISLSGEASILLLNSIGF